MEALSHYDSSDGEEEEGAGTEQLDIDPTKMAAKLKDLNSAPHVPIRVSINWDL